MDPQRLAGVGREGRCRRAEAVVEAGRPADVRRIGHAVRADAFVAVLHEHDGVTPLGAVVGAGTSLAGSDFALAAALASIVPASSMASMTIAPRCCAASKLRTGSYLEGAWIRPASRNIPVRPMSDMRKTFTSSAKIIRFTMPKYTLASFSPSPFRGEGQGEGSAAATPNPPPKPLPEAGKGNKSFVGPSEQPANRVHEAGQGLLGNPGRLVPAEVAGDADAEQVAADPGRQ